MLRHWTKLLQALFHVIPPRVLTKRRGFSPTAPPPHFTDENMERLDKIQDPTEIKWQSWDSNQLQFNSPESDTEQEILV